MMTAKRLFDIPHNQLKTQPNESMFVSKVNGEWKPTSTQQFIDQTIAVSKGLIALGVQPGENVALVSNTRYEWNVMDIAIQQIGAIVVPLYPNISEAEYNYIFNDAGIRLAVVANEELAGKINNIKPNLSKFELLFSMEEVAGVRNWNEIAEEGKSIEASAITERGDKVQITDLATIIYTSGTTGNPKGVMLSHSNILSNVEACIEPLPVSAGSKVLTFLPVCHVYERMLHYLYMHVGASIYFAESLETIGDNIREVQPECFTAVPRLIEKVFDKIVAKGDELTGIKRKLFFWAVSLGERYEPQGNGFFYNIQLGIANKIIFSKWREALGGHVKAIASGSAALQPRLNRIFCAAGIPILEGFGLTETSPVVSVNNFQAGIRIGTVGPLIEKVEVKIAEDGEILVKGPNVMMGYYNKPTETAEVIDADGWFHTGDIGIFVDNKFLKITDRKKEIFKTSGGKYIAPQHMENKFKESRFIEQIMVIGENEKFPSAFIVPSFSFVKDWAAQHDLDLSNASNEEIANHPKVKERIQKEVLEINKVFGNWEQIKKTFLLPAEFSVEGGELTPTLKLKRKKILEKYTKQYQEIYA
ncbi:MAG: AMP-binding protein [Bacteroidota bacterium]